MSYRNTPFSVAMSVYKNDSPEQLRIALDSICLQSCPPDEIYLVIDGPIGEELRQIIDEYSKKYQCFTINQLNENKGLGNALKIAVENAKYDLIARMDSDDISAPGRFKKQIDAYLEEPADVIGGWTLGFFGDLNTGDIAKFNSKLLHHDIVKQLQHSTPVSHVTVLLRRKAVMDAGNYKDLYYHEDYYLWARMIKNGCLFRNIPEYLVYVRCGEEQAKRHGGWKYFSAELKLRNYMLKNSLTSFVVYLKEMTIRFIYQIIMPSTLRVFVDKKFKRKHISRNDADLIINNNSVGNETRSS